LDKRSFSFEKSRLGKWYFLKLFLLIICTIFLSWYSNSNHNSLFCNKLHIIIRNKEIYLKYQQNNVKNRKLVIAAPEISATCKLFSELTGNWELLTEKLCFDSSFSIKPPLAWSFINACSTSVTPARWPQPFTSQQARVSNSKLKKVYPFNDLRSGLEIVFGKVPCLIINSNNFYCTFDEKTMYKEYYECIILTESDSLLSDIIRSCFRPRFLISITDNKNQLPNYSNVIYPDKFHSETVFKITSLNTLELD